MASTCYQPIADSYPYEPILNLDFQLSKPPASSDATALGCAASFNLSPDRRFQGLPAAGQPLPSGCTADPSEEAEIPRSKSIIDLTLDDDDDSAGDKNAIEVS